MGKLKDLRGQAFGRLTVKHFAGIWGGHAHWCCECACYPGCYECKGGGCVCRVRGSKVISGAIKSCGCSRTDSDIKRSAAKKIPHAVKVERAKCGQKAKSANTHAVYSLTVDRAADLVGCSTERMRILCEVGVLRSKTDKLGYRRVSATDVAEYIAYNAAGNPVRCEVK